MYNGLCIYCLDTHQVNNNAHGWIIDEAKNNNINLTIKFEENIEIMVKENTLEIIDETGTDLSQFDFVLMRCNNYDLAKAFEMKNILVFNSSKAIEKTQDKWMTFLELIHSDIKMPRTKLFFNQAINQALEMPFVLKNRFGSKGRNIHLIENYEMLKALDLVKGDWIQQDFIKESAGEDIRVHVIGHEAIVGIYRFSSKDFRSNYSLGGQSKEYPLCKQLIKLSEAITRILDIDIAGLDFLISGDEFLLCEVNANAGFRTVYNNTTINYPDRIFKYIHKVLTTK